MGNKKTIKAIFSSVLAFCFLTFSLPTSSFVMENNEQQVAEGVSIIKNGDYESNIQTNTTSTSSVSSTVYSSVYDSVYNQYGVLSEEIYTTQSATSTVFSVPSGTVNGQLNVVLQGNTVVNLLGNDGDCEDLSKWHLYGNVGYDTTCKLFGSKDIRLAVADNSQSYIYKTIASLNLRADKYYLVSAYLTCNGGTKTRIELSGSTKGVEKTDNAFTRVGFVATPSDLTVAQRLGIVVLGTNGSFAFVDGVQINEITQTEFSTLTVNQLLSKYSYITNARSGGSIRIKSIGKNLFDGQLKSGVYSGWSLSKTITLQHGKTYTLKNNYTDNIGIRYSDNSGQYGFAYSSGGSFTFTATQDKQEIRLGLVSNSNISLNNIQLEEGDIATAYLPYTESTTFISNELNSVGNVRDEINMGTGNYVKRIGKVVLNGSENWSDYSEANGVSRISIIGWNSDKNANDNFPNNADCGFGYGDRYFSIAASYDVPNTIVFRNNPDSRLVLYISKTDLTNMNYSADLNGMKKYVSDHPITLSYQLLQPLINYLSIAPATCYENGTIIIDNAVKGIAVYNRGIGISDRSLPIESIESIHRIEGSTYIPVDLSKVTIAADGLSFTIFDAQSGDKYEYVYAYESCLSTNPTITFSVPTNMQAQINDSLNMVKQQSDVINYLLSEISALKDEIEGRRINVGPFTINCQSGSLYNMVLAGSNSKDFSARKFTLLYNSTELEVVDLCASTPTLETTACNINGANIAIVRCDPGVIEFIISRPLEESTSWSGAVNTIIFRSKITGQATLSYMAE